MIILEKEKVKEVIVERNVGFTTHEVIIIVMIALVCGTLIGSFVSFKRNNTITKTNSNELSEFMYTYNNLTNDYYEKVDKDKLINSAIKGMIEYLDDPYTVYMEGKESEAFNETVEGEYYGIGALISKIEDKILVSGIFTGTPAEKYGLKIGDQLIKVNDIDITPEMTSEDVTKIIKDTSNNNVALKVLRDGTEQEIEIIKNKIDIPSVYSKTYERNDKKIGYIALSVFASNTNQQFINELKKIEEENIDSLIIDVRSNPGGHLSQVSQIINTFIDKSKVAYQIKSKGKIKPYYSNNNNPKKYNIVVLANGESASASELLAAALKESAGATIIGTKTYGKGTVQKAYPLSSGAIVKYTSEEWLTPNGNSINKTGITPDIEEELNANYYNDPKDENDNQLQRALDELSK